MCKQVTEQQKYPDNTLLWKWVTDMRKEYGEPSNWPVIGCNAIFKPWARGMSMVIAMLTFTERPIPGFVIIPFAQLPRGEDKAPLALIIT